MSVEILMPALSPTMEEGTLSKWLVKEGDKVVSGDLIAEIETDKATMEVESVEDGTIGKLLVLEGEEYIKVNAPIAILLFDGDSLPLKLPSKEKKEDEINVQVVSSNKLKEVDLEVNVEFKNEVPSIIKENKSIKKLKRIFSSPLARRIAKLKNIDLTSVLGSGPNGRILKIDIEGGEYLLMNDILKHLSKINVLIIEFHFIQKNKIFFLKFIKNLSKKLYVSHVHINNATFHWSDKAEIVECTFERKTHFKTKVNFSKLSYPLKNLDFPSSKKIADPKIIFK